MQRPCLYCGDTEKPKTEEHVLQKALGGSLTLDKDVCGDCNTKVFSPLDGLLIRYVQTLFYYGHDDVGRKRNFLQENLGSLRNDDTGKWTAARLDRDFKARILEQVVLNDDGEFRMTLSDGGDATRRGKTIVAELSRPDVAITKQLIDEGDPPMCPRLIRSSPGVYVARGTSEAVCDDLLGKVRAGIFREMNGMTPPQRITVPPPYVEVPITFDFGAVERALAKTALNFVCATWGGNTAREPVFDEIRQLALGNAIEEDSPVDLNVSREPEEPPYFVQPDHHVILLASTRHGAKAQIILYQRTLATVHLTSCPIGFRNFAIGVFNYKTRRHRIFPDEGFGRYGFPTWTAD